MRVIAGIHRGRVIETIEGKAIRPTTGMAREAIFNILGHGEFGGKGAHFLEGCDVLDLYTGCGALAVEAFSRGAHYVTLMDLNAEHLAIAKRNVEKIHGLEHANFIRADSSSPPPAVRPCDLVFVDPPYGEGLVETSLVRLLDGGWLKPGAVVVIEMEKRATLTLPEAFSELKNRVYGACRIVILKVSL